MKRRRTFEEIIWRSLSCVIVYRSIRDPAACTSRDREINHTLLHQQPPTFSIRWFSKFSGIHHLQTTDLLKLRSQMLVAFILDSFVVQASIYGTHDWFSYFCLSVLLLTMRFINLKNMDLNYYVYYKHMYYVFDERTVSIQINWILDVLKIKTISLRCENSWY